MKIVGFNLKAQLCAILLIGFCYGQLFELTHDNDSRIYWVDYPDNPTESVPLVISMHGRNQSLLSHITYSQMSSFANPQNIAVAYPQGINSTGALAWNTGVWWDNSEYDDVGYLNAIIDSVISNFAIDTNRIYACGMSNGGFMAYELACELSDRIVAFGSVAGNFMMNAGQECTSAREIPIMHIHGTSDLIVNYNAPTIDSSMTAIEAMDWWSIENDLVEQSLEELNDSVNVFTNSSLTSNTKFVHYQVQGGGHQWFNYNWGFHASEELLSFFMQYSMTDFENDDTPSIEGRWIIPVVESDPGNTMYEFLDGLRYTYYCSDENGCDSTYWNSLDTNDAIPNPNPYTFSNDTLTIDLFFGNTWQHPISFECDGNVVTTGDTTVTWWSSWWRVGYDISECEGQELALTNATKYPETFKLSQNYPNPFNPVTSLRYDLPEDGLVNITVYDMMGRVVKTLVNNSQTAGYKSIQWNATNNRNEPISAGLYLYAIQAGEFRQTKKMVLLK